MNRAQFIKAASERYTKTDIKRFLKACDRELPGRILDYRKNFVVGADDGHLYAYSDASCVPCFYRLEIA